MGGRVLLREFSPLCPNGICDITLLNEEEKRMKDDGQMILTGVLQSANKKNGNMRIYPREVLLREVENYQKFIRENRALGECDHTDEPVVNLKNASHMVLRTWWEGNDVWGTLKILRHTPSGKIVEGLIKDGVQVGISSRGLGSVREGSDGTVIVEDDFQLLCWDIVSDPSTANAFLHLQEVKNIDINKIFTREDRINRLLNDVLKK